MKTFTINKTFKSKLTQPSRYYCRNNWCNFLKHESYVIIKEDEDNIFAINDFGFQQAISLSYIRDNVVILKTQKVYPIP